MPESDEPLIHTCQACGALIDISESEPLVLVHCPSCGTGQRVRTQFDHFQLQEILGGGGMGTVYRAFDQALNRFVALKLLRQEYSADADFIEQFQREAAITASINHPNVVRVFSAGADHGLVYIAMELVDKGSLDDLMTLQGRVAEMQVLEVGAQIARGLDAALRRGLIHRDVKPGNILFADAHSAKIVDFGLAQLQHQAVKPGEVWGTPYYVAPEKLDNPPTEDFRSDMYSLGATMFHAIAGRPPYEADTASMVALKHLKSQSVSVHSFAPDVSSTAAFVINKALSKNPDDRYTSYEELAEHLDYARSQLVATAGTIPQRSRVQGEHEDDTKAMSWITFAMVAVVVIGGLGVWLMRDKLFDKGGQRVSETTEKARQRMGDLEPKFTEARALLVRNQPKPAAEAFAQIAQEPDVPQPLLNWLTLHEGFALLAAGNERDSRTVFGQLASRAPFGRSPEDQKLAAFFSEISRPLEGADALPATVAKDYDKNNYEAIALLLIGLKDWHLGKYEDATSLFRQFRSSGPAAPYQWIADYKTISAPYIEEYVSVQSAIEEARRATTRSARSLAIESLKRAKAQLKLAPALGTSLDELVAKLEGDIAAEKVDNEKRMAESEAADAPKMKEAKTKCAQLVAAYRFADARTVADGIRMESDKFKTEQKALKAHMEALANFKTLLIRDVTTSGYTGQLVRRTGAAVPANRVTANDAQLTVQTQYGGVNLAWPEVAPDSLIAAAKSFLRPDLSPDAAADRQWALGIYALSMGRKEIAREYINTAAQAKSTYAEAKQLLESTIPGGL